MQTGEPLIHAGEDRFLPALIFKLGREFRASVDRALGPLGITSQQAAVLVVTSRYGDRPVSRVADALGTDAAGMTRLVDRLVSKGLAARESSADDRRAIAIRVTPAGEALLPGVVAAFHETQEHLFNGIADEDLARFRSVLLRMRENLRRDAEVAGC